MAFVLLVALVGCERIRWTEDVRLPDGRTITLTRLQNYGGPTEIGQRSSAMDYWLEFTNPDTRERVRWQSDRDLATVALLIYDRTPYLLLEPGFGSSLHKLGCPNPLYLLYRYEGGRWLSTPLAGIPVKRVRANVTSAADKDLREGRIKHLPVERTQDSYVLNDRPWIMDFTNVDQTFDPKNCNRELDYLLVAPEGRAGEIHEE